ncbi:hypothetical protein KM043_005881 [Ampulex compressa]|nr:hypothetical protein KM043_005881 [Ampulex compressa]
MNRSVGSCVEDQLHPDKYPVSKLEEEGPPPFQSFPPSSRGPGFAAVQFHEPVHGISPTVIIPVRPTRRLSRRAAFVPVCLYTDPRGSSKDSIKRGLGQGAIAEKSLAAAPGPNQQLQKEVCLPEERFAFGGNRAGVLNGLKSFETSFPIAGAAAGGSLGQQNPRPLGGLEFGPSGAARDGALRRRLFPLAAT